MNKIVNFNFTTN